MGLWVRGLWAFGAPNEVWGWEFVGLGFGHVKLGGCVFKKGLGFRSWRGRPNVKFTIQSFRV